MMFKKNNQKGETIVEVVVACIVIGVVLTGAFTGITGGFKIYISARENNQALEYGKSQIEQLSSDKTMSTNLSPGVFCYKDGVFKVYNESNGDCLFGQKYRLSITKNQTNINEYTYTILAKWDGIENKSELNLYYKL